MIHEIVIAQYESVIKTIEDKPNINISMHVCIILNSLVAESALKYFRDNHPEVDKHSKFYDHPDFRKNGSITLSWWYPQTEAANNTNCPFNNANKQRVLFLKHLIRQLKKEIKK